MAAPEGPPHPCRGSHDPWERTGRGQVAGFLPDTAPGEEGSKLGVGQKQVDVPGAVVLGACSRAAPPICSLEKLGSQRKWRNRNHEFAEGSQLSLVGLAVCLHRARTLEEGRLNAGWQRVRGTVLVEGVTVVRTNRLFWELVWHPPP